MLCNLLPCTHFGAKPAGGLFACNVLCFASYPLEAVLLENAEKLTAFHLERQKKLTEELHSLRGRPHDPAASQNIVLLPWLSSFVRAEDDPEWRKIWGFLRAFGIPTADGLANGDNILHKLCMLASPPWNVEATIAAVSQVLDMRARMNIDVNAQCGDGSTSLGSRAIDLICNNKSPDGDKPVKPEILKLLIAANADMAGVGHFKPPIFAAAGTANLDRCKILVEAGCEWNIMHKGTNLALYDNYSSALRSTLHLFIRR